MRELVNTKSHGRRLAREMFRDGMPPRELTGTAATLAVMDSPTLRRHLIAGFTEEAHRIACWNGLCVLVRHADDAHSDVTGHGWRQAPGEAYCPEHHTYDTCDWSGSPVVTFYER